MEPIKFIGSLASDHRVAVNFYGDGSAKISILTDASQIAEVMRLLTLTETAIEITMISKNESPSQT